MGSYQFAIDGREYSGKTLNARQQMKLSKRLTALVGPFVAAAGKDDASNAETMRLFCQEINKIEDTDLDYIVDHCLKDVQIQKDGHWSNVLSSGGTIMHQEIDNMVDIGQIIYHVVRENLGGFFDILPSSITALAGEQTSNRQSTT